MFDVDIRANHFFTFVDKVFNSIVILLLNTMSFKQTVIPPTLHPPPPFVSSLAPSAISEIANLHTVT